MVKDQLIPLASIDVGPRLRAVNQTYAQAIATNASETVKGVARGIRQAIEVRPAAEGRYTLISGAHRLRAAEILGLETIPAKVCRVSADEAKLLEIDENLIRHDLTELDRAFFLVERQAAYEALHPEAKHGANQHTGGDDKLVVSFADSAADKLGISPRSIQRSVARYRGIDAETRRAIRHSWIADSGAQLDALLKLAPPERLQVVEAMLREDWPEGQRAPATVGAARQMLGLVAPREVANKAQQAVDGIMKQVRAIRADGVRRQLAEKLAGYAPLREVLIEVLQERGDLNEGADQ